MGGNANVLLGDVLEGIKNHWTCARKCKFQKSCAGFGFKRNQRYCQLIRVGTDFEDNKATKIWSLYKRHTFC